MARTTGEQQGGGRDDGKEEKQKADKQQVSSPNIPQKMSPRKEHETGSSATGKETGQDAVSLLKSDHRKVEALFKHYEKTKDDEDARTDLVEQIAQEFLTHSRIEEEIFYPACLGKVEMDMLEEAQVEHDGAKLLLSQLRHSSPDAPYFDAKVKVLCEYIRHHVAEEEKSGDGIFDAAVKAGVDVEALGKEISQRREEIAQRVKEESTPPTPSLNQPKGDNRKETMMAQQDYLERSRNRSSSRYDEDDDYRGGNGGGRRMPPRDEEGRFMSEDRGDDRRYRSGSSGRNRDEDDRGRSSGRQGSGWYGDSEGHSEASRRGWDERRGYRDDEDDRRYRSSARSREDDDYERGGSSRSRASGRYDEDERGRGHGGWFGDPEGHAEASRRGWDERGRSSRDDDDDRRYRSSRSRDDDDYGRGGPSRSRASSRDDDDDRGRGHGGWFGDTRGHSEAARRGWANR